MLIFAWFLRQMEEIHCFVKRIENLKFYYHFSFFVSFVLQAERKNSFRIYSTHEEGCRMDQLKCLVSTISMTQRHPIVWKIFRMLIPLFNVIENRIWSCLKIIKSCYSLRNYFFFLLIFSPLLFWLLYFYQWVLQPSSGICILQFYHQVIMWQRIISSEFFFYLIRNEIWAGVGIKFEN